jgi:hypothetical protein
MSTNVKSLFAGAKAGGDIGKQALQVLAIPDLGMQIQAGLGVSVDDVPSSEVTLVNILVDDSGSISGNEDTMRAGVNSIIESLEQSKQRDGIIVSIRYLNGTQLTPYAPLDAVPKLDASNYQANGGTPLYDQSVVICGQVIAKRQEFTDGGVVCRAVTAIITDGADLHSRSASAKDVAKVVKDMLATESHIVIGMGIGNESYFRDIFKQMGIEDKWILTPGNSKSEIRKAFAVVSQSAVRASQGAAGFSKTASAGFTSP